MAITQADADLIATTIWAKHIVAGTTDYGTYQGLIATIGVRLGTIANTQMPALTAKVDTVQTTLNLQDGADIDYIKDKLDDLTSDPAGGDNPTVDAVRYGVAHP